MSRGDFDGVCSSSVENAVNLCNLPTELLFQITEWTNYDLALAHTCSRLLAIHLSGKWVNAIRDPARVLGLLLFRSHQNPSVVVEQMRDASVEQKVDLVEWLLEIHPNQTLRKVDGETFQDEKLIRLWEDLGGCATKIADFERATFEVFFQWGRPRLPWPRFAKFLHKRFLLYGEDELDLSVHFAIFEFGMIHDSVALPRKLCASQEIIFSQSCFDHLTFKSKEDAALLLLEELTKPTNPLRSSGNWGFFSISFFSAFCQRIPAWSDHEKAKRCLPQIYADIRSYWTRDGDSFHRWKLELIDLWRNENCGANHVKNFMEGAFECHPTISNATEWIEELADDLSFEKFESLLAFPWSSSRICAAAASLIDEYKTPFPHQCLDLLIRDPRCDPHWNNSKILKLALVHDLPNVVAQLEHSIEVDSQPPNKKTRHNDA